MRVCGGCSQLWGDDARVCGTCGKPLPAPDPIIGLTVGSYRIVGVRGHGGMGTVYLGLDEAAGQRVAVKVLSGRFTQRPDLVERFQREADAVGKIVHPNIVEFHHYGVLEDGRPYYVMELLEGEDLASYLRRIGWISAGEAIHMIAQVLDAISVAHAGGIVHRDLKPENLFVARAPDGARSMKVLDFGVAKFVDTARIAAHTSSARRTLEGVVVGSGPYMSPEQAAGRTQEIGPATDLFTLGVVLYLMLTGEYPFTQIAGVSAFHRPPAPPSQKVPGLPEGIDELLTEMLTINPANRVKSASAVAHALRSLAPALPPIGAADGVSSGGSNAGAAVQTIETAATVVPPLTGRMGPASMPMMATLPRSNGTARATSGAAFPTASAPALATPPAEPEPPEPATIPHRPASEPIIVTRPPGYVPRVPEGGYLPPTEPATPSSGVSGGKVWTTQIIRIKRIERSSSQLKAVFVDDDEKLPGWAKNLIGIVILLGVIAALWWFAR